MANTNSLQESATLGSATPRDAGGLLRATRERISAGDEPAQAAAWRVLRRQDADAGPPEKDGQHKRGPSAQPLTCS